jgi:hypothetical protein
VTVGNGAGTGNINVTATGAKILMSGGLTIGGGSTTFNASNASQFYVQGGDLNLNDNATLTATGATIVVGDPAACVLTPQSTTTCRNFNVNGSNNGSAETLTGGTIVLTGYYNVGQDNLGNLATANTTFTATNTLLYGAGNFSVTGSSNNQSNFYGGATNTNCPANNGASGVTIVLNGTSSQVKTSGTNTTFCLFGPASAWSVGIPASIAIWEPNSTVGVGSANFTTFAAQSSLGIQGVVYLPKAALSYTGFFRNNPFCTQIVAQQINFVGLAMFFSGTCGLPGFNANPVTALVE